MPTETLGRPPAPARCGPFFLCLLFSCVALAACSSERGGATAGDEIGEPVDFELEVPDWSQSDRPRSRDGRLLLTQNKGMQLLFDPEARSPLTTQGGCALWVMRCFEPGQRSLDDCFHSAPRCETETPWEEDQVCCPAACYHQYARMRHEGTEAYPAYDETLYVDGSCVPRLQSYLEGGEL